jgi:uncharacterized membrane protein
MCRLPWVGFVQIMGWFLTYAPRIGEGYVAVIRIILCACLSSLHFYAARIKITAANVSDDAGARSIGEKADEI